MLKIQGIAVANDSLKRVSNGCISIDQRIMPTKPSKPSNHLVLYYDVIIYDSFLDDKDSAVFDLLVSHERKWNWKSES